MVEWAEALDISGYRVRAYLVKARAIRDELLGTDAASSVEYSPVTPVVMGIARMLQAERLALVRGELAEPNRG